MKKIVLSLAFLFTAFQFATAQIPVLGIYQNTTIIAAGGNAMVTPMAAPTNAASITAYTSTSFKGILQVNPTTGIVTITNANPAGTYTIYVKAFNGTASAINNFTLTVNNTLCSQGLFRAAPDVVVPSGPGCIAVGDFNNDGKQDMVMASSNSNNAIIRLGDGSGNFTAVANVIIGGGGQSVATADFNGDGNADFATTNNNNTVSVRLGNGLGGFTGTTNFAVGTNPTSIAIGDFNGDGKADFAIANTNSINVSIRLGDGVGGFSGTTNITIGYSPYTVAIGDFNGDGKADFVTGNISNNTVSVCLGDGTGGFGGVNNITVGQIPNSLAIGDFNADGKQDLAMANSSTNTIFIRLGDGAGNFSGTASAVVGNAPNLVATGDFNGDGKLDVAALNLNSNSVSICLGNGSGGISAVKSTILSPYFSYPSSLAVGDFNNDGRQDFASGITSTGPPVFIRLGGENEINVKGNNVDINDGDDTTSATDGTDFGTLIGNKTVRTFSIQNTGSVNLAISNIVLSGTDTALFKVDSITLPATIAAGASVTFKLIFIPTTDGLKTATINILNDDCNESVYDFKIQGTGATPVLGSYAATTILTAGGNGMVMPAAPPANAATISAYTTSKFKGILQVNPTTGLLTIINAHPAGTYLITVKAFNGLLSSVTTSFTLTVSNPLCSQAQFTAKPNLYIGGTVSGIAISDFNNDNKQDFVTCVPELNSITIRLGDGAGGFITSPYIAVGASPYTVTTGDFNGDGKQDIATANYTQATVSISLGNGSGSFNTTTNISVAGSPISIATGDFNADGKPDIATASYANSLVSIRLGNGAGTFTGTTEIPVGTNPYAVVIGDFNNDDKPDLITANYNSANVSVRIGDGAGGFNGAINIPVGSGPRGVATGDFNGDGNADFATANLTAGTVSVRLGNGTGGFTGSTTLAAGAGTSSVTIGDYNGDGKQDIAAMALSSYAIYIFVGDGTGNFTPAPTISANLGPQMAAVGDFDGDGRQDFAIANAGGASISVRLGNTNEVDVIGNNISIVDNSTLPDTANHTQFGSVSNNLVRTYTIRNTGNVNLTVSNITVNGADASMFRRSGITLPAIIAVGGSTTFNVTFTPTSTGIKSATVTINNDDCDEALYDFAIQATGIIVIPTLGTYSDTTIASNGNIALIPSTLPVNPISINAYASTGFKGQIQVDTTTGKLNITNAHPAGNYLIKVKAIHGISSDTTSFRLIVNSPACSQGLFSGTGTITGSAGSRSVVVCDFNNDGKQDIIIANPNSSNIITFAGNGLGGFTLASFLSVYTGSFPASLSIADFNGDGKQDMAIANTNLNTVSVRLGNGTGAFNGITDMPDITVGDGPAWVVTDDFNKDGKPDFAAANTNGNTVSIRLGDGTGRFAQSTELTVGANPFAIAIGDFNSDSIPDLATANNIGNTVSISLGNGNGNFTTIANLPVGNSPVSVVAGDFNGDNKQDIAVSNQSSNTVSVLLGNGMGGFSGAANLVTASIPLALAVGDFNGDTKQDLAITINGNNIVEIRLGDGAGGFGLAKNIIVGTNPRSVAICDFNGDGRQDMVTANAAFASNTGSIRFGNVNDILVKGNNTNISLGDATPAEADFTDFGVTVAGVATQRTFVIKNTGAVNLTVNNILFTGADASRFTLAGMSLPVSIAAGDSTTFTLSFTAAADGIKTATVTIVNDDCDESNYDFAIKAGSTAGVALDFDGINDYISINDSIGNSGTAGITYSAWLKTSSTAAQTIISKGNDCATGSFGYFGITATGRLIANFADNTTIQTVTGTTAINNGAWHQATVVRNGNILNLYVDGQMDASANSTAIANMSNTDSLLIGALTCNSSIVNYFSGQMDEVRIYKSALTICEIQNNLTCELNGPQPGLQAYYKFNQGRALESNTAIITLKDETVNGSNGALHNFTLADSTSNWIKSGGVVAGQACSNFNVWLGNSNNWDDANNWSKGFVPGECTKVMVNSGVPFMPQIISSQSSCFSLLLLNGATVTVKNTGHLHITGKN